MYGMCVETEYCFYSVFTTRHDTRGPDPGLTPALSSTPSSWQVLENTLFELINMHDDCMNMYEYV